MTRHADCEGCALSEGDEHVCPYDEDVNNDPHVDVRLLRGLHARRRGGHLTLNLNLRVDRLQLTC